MDARSRRAIALLIRRGIGNIVRGTLLKREFLLPFVVVYHITYRCNGHCAFCSRAKDISQSNERCVDLDRLEVILRAIKKLAPTLYFNGGEPTLEPSLGDALKLARQIGFWPVCVGTNATILDKRPDVPKLADKLVVSLHAGTPLEHAKVLGISQRQGERVFDNIIQASQVAKSYGNTLTVNCVLAGNDIEESYGVMEFCVGHEIPFAVVPAIQKHMPMIAGADAEKLRAYRDFLGEVIRLKIRQPSAVVGIVSHLRHIQRLNRFQCRPSAIITISPEGNIVNPCDNKYQTVPQTLGKADGTESIESQLRHQLDFGSAYKSCSGNCLKMCYLGPALFLERPWPSASDILS